MCGLLDILRRNSAIDCESIVQYDYTWMNRSIDRKERVLRGDTVSHDHMARKLRTLIYTVNIQKFGKSDNQKQEKIKVYQQ